MAVKVRVDGLRELESRLAKLPKSTGKSVLRRVLKSAAQPVVSAMAANAPRDYGTLAESAAVSTKLTSRQRSLHRKMFKDDKAAVEMFAGMGGLPAATQQEFGNENHGPQPFARPAWDAHKMDVLETIKAELGGEIMKAATRLARKAAKGK